MLSSEKKKKKRRKRKIFGTTKMTEIVPLSATQPLKTSVPICETYLQFQEKSSGHEKAGHEKAQVD